MAETIILPGGVDVHVHFREPGDNKAETIESGSRAALLGGFVLVADMPNNPGRPTWSFQAAREKHELIVRKSHIPMVIYAGSQPEQDNIDELERMARECLVVKFYGAPTTGNELDYEATDFLPAIKEWDRVAPDKPIMLHAGHENLRDFINLVAMEYGHHLHVCHVHSVEEVREVASAKMRGLPVTCGVCPHHLLMTSHDESTRGPFARMKPPLAPQTDTEALMAYLADGTIDIVETDHAPHTLEAKWGSKACYGVPGIEFAIPLLMYQVKQGKLSMDRLIDAISTKPSHILGVDVSTSEVEWTTEEYRIDDEAAQVISGAAWTPYLGMLAVGRLRSVQIGNRQLVDAGEMTNHRLPAFVAQRGTII